MSIKVAINGFGRIGRPTFRIALNSKNLEVVAINDLTDNKTLAHLLKYDSLYGKFDREVSYDEQNIVVDGKKFRVYSEKDPANLPWKELGVDVVLECTGYFTTREGAEKHLQAGAKRVLLSAPPKSPDIPTFVLGVNEKKFNIAKDLIVSNGSCTTNCFAPVVKVLNDTFGIKKGLMTTIHSYTNDQRLLDLPHRDLRRARAAAQNMIPTTTGSAKSVIAVLPEMEGKLDALAIRVPTPVVSVIDFVVQVSKATNVEEVNNAFQKEAQGSLKEILGVTNEPLVSSDFRGDPRSVIVDLASTKVIDDMIKIIGWYDNEWAYACRYVEMAEYIGKKLS